MKRHVVAIALAYIAACSSIYTAPMTTPKILRGNAARFDGQQVQVVGYLTMEHENYNLWSTRYDEEEGFTSKCVSLRNYGWLKDRAEEFNRRIVKVQGTFRKDVVDGNFLVRLGACDSSAIEMHEGESPVIVR